MVRTLLVSILVSAAVVDAAQEQPLLSEPVPEFEALLKSMPRNLDGRIALVYRLARHEPGRPALLGTSVDAESLQVSLRFSKTLTPGLVGAVQEAGCRIEKLPGGQPANVGPVLEARCRWAELGKLTEVPGIVLVSPTFGRRILPPGVGLPASRVAMEVEAVSLRRKLAPVAGRGKGVTIADMDSGFDPFHPALFRADGGAFDWIDVNHNGRFDPSVDSVDLNLNGISDFDEVLGVLKATIYSLYTDQIFNETLSFVPSVDWLFQDENGDSKRNYGPTSPYGDGKPTFGEQLFVADDVNGNGLLDVGERIIRLNTPKVKAARTANGTVYRRGVDLAQFPEAYEDARMHGTMVFGTLSGDDPRYHLFAGMAPDAELVHVTMEEQDMAAGLAWVQSEGAQLVLWEMATWYFEYLDGSSNLELACDTASNEGVLQIGAAGNLGGSQKHRLKLLAAGTEVVPLVVPSPSSQLIFGNFNWSGELSSLSFTVKVNGLTVAVTTPEGQAGVGNGAAFYWSSSRSLRGTSMWTFYLRSANSYFPAQTIEFSVTNSGPPVQMHGYVSDDYSSWYKGVHWPVSTGATDFGTYGTPAVGDKTLAIGTMGLDFLPPGNTSGALMNWSGRGPRSDGKDTIDFVAPEDLITALSGYDRPYGSMFVGGGTSNASPVAVGLLALLKEGRPDASPEALRSMMASTAQVEPQMGAVPNDSWGAGKVRVYRARLGGALPHSSAVPVVEAVAERDGKGGLRLDATGTQDPEGGAVKFLWDVDYDGEWDLGPTGEAIQRTPLPATPPAHVKLQAIDPDGMATTVLVPLTDAPPVIQSDAGSSLPDGGAITLPSVDGGAPSVASSQAPGCGCNGAPSSGIAALLCCLALRAVQGRRMRRSFETPIPSRGISATE